MRLDNKRSVYKNYTVIVIVYYNSLREDQIKKCASFVWNIQWRQNKISSWKRYVCMRRRLMG